MIQRKAFTLIELIISISILSIMMLYLYQSYASLNRSNDIVQKDTQNILSMQKLKKVIFLDYSLALHKSVKIVHRDSKEDFVFFQSSHSLHKRYNPYIAYIVKANKLYRLESLKAFKSYDLGVDAVFDVDFIGEVENFRVYKSTDLQKEKYLLDIDFKNIEDLILKVRVLNEF
ncbi:MAG: prepilin-type N-terminal cleavage/methylation domain-containing protein [Sulfurimonas sp.]|jgi:prepilin-type N-terminal cleavage/methylation domain-containing protein|uniref:prepilin-type N-terminal cleavage/methylation domain-containing protein n=1 Tax=Sulfurimonas sp. TaxID=2022749 RepID=UPI0039E69EC2